MQSGKRSAQTKTPSSLEICILAGGLSRRMGRDKSRLKLGGRTFTGLLRQLARSAGLPSRVIRADLIGRVGPLGGVYTGLKTTRSDSVLFLACDMPLVNSGLLQWIIRRFPAQKEGLAVRHRDRIGFPLLIRCSALPIIIRQLASNKHSLRSLFQQAGMCVIDARKSDKWALLNVNTPEDLKNVRAAAEIHSQFSGTAACQGSRTALL